MKNTLFGDAITDSKNNILLVDFSMLVFRSIYVSRIYGDEPEEYKGLFFHHVLNLLQKAMTKYKVQAKNTYLCKDTRKGNWRKSVYPLYKASRKINRNDDDFDWEIFYEILEELNTIFNKETKLKNLEVPGAEADDILYVLSKEMMNSENKVIVMTSDKDLKQVLRHGTIYYDPMKKREIKDFSETSMLNHILIGDKADDIPSVKDETEFSLEFLSFLKKNNIFLEDIQEVKNLEVFKSLIQKFIKENSEDSNTFVAYKKIFKPGRFGVKTADKILRKGNNGLQEFLNENKLYQDHFERNEILIDLENIPEGIYNNILQEFKRVESDDNSSQTMFGLQNWMVKNELKEVRKHIYKFLK